MRVGRPAQLAWSLAGACVALVLGSLMLLLAASHVGDTSQYYYEDAAVAVAFALLGAVVAAHRPENPIGWLFLAIGLSGALGVVSNEYVHYTLVVDPGALPGGSVAAWLSGWTLVACLRAGATGPAGVPRRPPAIPPLALGCLASHWRCRAHDSRDCGQHAPRSRRVCAQ
jgi:hypothetical protein